MGYHGDGDGVGVSFDVTVTVVEGDGVTVTVCFRVLVMLGVGGPGAVGTVLQLRVKDQGSVLLLLVLVTVVEGGGVTVTMCVRVLLMLGLAGPGIVATVVGLLPQFQLRVKDHRMLVLVLVAVVGLGGAGWAGTIALGSLTVLVGVEVLLGEGNILLEGFTVTQYVVVTLVVVEEETMGAWRGSIPSWPTLSSSARMGVTRRACDSQGRLAIAMNRPWVNDMMTTISLCQ